MSNRDLEVMANVHLQAEVVALRKAAAALAEALEAAEEWHAAYPYHDEEFELATSAEVWAKITIALRQWEEVNNA